MGFGVSAERMTLSMGQLSSPDRESFHIGMARLAYIEGSISLDEFEISVAHVLCGGTLLKDGRAPRSSTALWAQRQLDPESAAFYQPKPPPNEYDAWVAREACVASVNELRRALPSSSTP